MVDGQGGLAGRRCSACVGGVEALKGAALEGLVLELGGGWEVVEGKKLVRGFKFKNFAEALAFVDRVGAIAEAEGHHPDICFGWGRAEVDIWTHKIGGLSEADFILAAKISKVYEG